MKIELRIKIYLNMKIELIFSSFFNHAITCELILNITTDGVITLLAREIDEDLVMRKLKKLK